MRHMAPNSRTRSFYGPNDGGKMNMGPEVYPPEALADEEPRYLRRQKPLEIRRRKFPRKNWPAYRRWLLVGAGIVGGGWAVYQGMRFFLYSSTVQLAHYDQIEISGIHYVNRSSITEKFSDDLGKTVLRIPLEARRTAIEGIPWVAQASARRVLPSRIRIVVI